MKDVYIRTQEHTLFVGPPRQTISGYANCGIHTWLIRSGYWPITLKWKLCCQLFLPQFHKNLGLSTRSVLLCFGIFLVVSPDTHAVHSTYDCPQQHINYPPRWTLLSRLLDSQPLRYHYRPLLASDEDWLHHPIMHCCIAEYGFQGMIILAMPKILYAALPFSLNYKIAFSQVQPWLPR